MLGSHNSGSFAKQIGWTKFLPKFFSRCQKLDFEQQYALGVRYFDLRVTRYKGGYYLAHGLARYNVELLDVIRLLSRMEEKCYFNIIIEDTFFEFKGNIKFLKWMSSGYRAELHHITSKKTGKCYYQSPILDKTVDWMIPTAKKWDIHIPVVDCKDINRIFSKDQAIKSNSVMLFDFVETLR